MSKFEKIREMMIPLNKAVIASEETRLKDAIPALRRLCCEVEEGKCTKDGFRAILILDEDQHLVGILDFQSIVKILVPEVSGNFMEKVHALWDSLGAVSRFGPIDEAKLSLKTRIAKNAEKRIGDFMRRIRGMIDADAGVLEALMVICETETSVLPVYDGGQLAGIIRDSDLFLKLIEMLEQTSERLFEKSVRSPMPKDEWAPGECPGPQFSV